MSAEEREKYMKWPCTVVEKILFKDLVDCFEKVLLLRKRHDQHRQLLSNKLYKMVVKVDESLFALLRLIIPRADRSRGQYGLAVKKIAKLYIAELGLLGQDAERLEKYDNPNVFVGCEGVVIGDFSHALEYVLKDRAMPHADNTRKRLNIRDINDILDQLERSSKKEDQRKIISHLLQHCSATEQKWFVRIVLRDMKIGVKEDGLLGYLHPDAVQMFNMCRDLSLVCGVLRNPKKRHAAKLSPLLPCSPMLAQKLRTWKDVSNWISKHLNGGNQFVFEEKLDGHRILLHKKGKKIKLFSRKGLDHTHEYLGFFAKFVSENILVDECILDGELLAWDQDAGRFNEFMSNMKGLFNHYLEKTRILRLLNLSGMAH